MPYSSNVFDKKILEIVKELNPKTIYDIGAGAGKYGRLVKTSFENIGLVAVEIDEEYIRRFDLKNLYDKVINMSAIDLISPEYYDTNFDVVIIGDCIEHLKKSDGIDLLNFLVYRSRWIIIQYPIKYLQNIVGGKHQEAHISAWHNSDFQFFDVFKSLSAETQELTVIKGYLV